AESITVRYSSSNLLMSWTSENLTLTASSVEALDISLAAGADTLTLEDLRSAGLNSVSIDAGKNDGVRDSISIKGTADQGTTKTDESFVLSTSNDSDIDGDGLNDSLLSVQRVGVHDITISNLNRTSGGDNVTIETFGGNDNLNAAGATLNL